MPKILKKKSEEFVKKATAMLLELGAKESGRSHYQHDLNTIAGNLRLQVEEVNIYCYSVFTKFDSPEIAKDKVAFVNKHSGKWNFHIESTMNIDEVIDLIKIQIESVLLNHT